MTTDTHAIPSRIGDAMLAAELVNRDQLALAIQKQQVTGERLGELMLRLGIVSEFDLARLLADQSDIQFVDIETQTAALLRIRQVYGAGKIIKEKEHAIIEKLGPLWPLIKNR